MKYSVEQFSAWIVALGAAAFFCIGCKPFQRDQARELVNAAGGSPYAVSNLLARGADVNARSKTTFGWTPLISAIYHHKEDVVDLLLVCGADVNIGDSMGDTPLNWTITVWEENTNLIRKLVRRGANPKIRNRYGSDAFDLAGSKRNSDEISEIIRSERPSQPQSSAPVP
jgi:ankyrin repeat protein